jgi:hypothetical protein
MSKIVMFEDDLYFQENAKTYLADHQFVAEASTIGGAFSILGRMATGELETDVLLLDGNLDQDFTNPVFRRNDYLPPLPEPPKRRFRKTILPKSEFSLADYKGLHQDARLVFAVMKACDIDVPIVGISSGSLREEAGIPVSAEVRKGYFEQLPQVVARLIDEC